MFGALIDLFILISLAAFALIAWKFFQQRADEKLRDNPPPKRIVEVSLPVGVSDSAANMSRFYRKAATAALGDKGARKSGMGQIDFVYLVDVPAEGALPRMRCRIYTDPDKMEAVKKALKSSFQEAIDLVELSEDELLPIAQVLRPKDDNEILDFFQDDEEPLEGAIAPKEKDVPEEVLETPLEEAADDKNTLAEEVVEEQSKEESDIPEEIKIPKRPSPSQGASIDFVLDEEEGPPKF